MSAQCDEEGNWFNLIDCIVDHKTVKNKSDIQQMVGTCTLHGKTGQQVGKVWQISRRETVWKLFRVPSPITCTMRLLLYVDSRMCSRSAAVSLVNPFGIEVPNSWDDCVIMDMENGNSL
jgi:hypothetical protein